MDYLFLLVHIPLRTIAMLRNMTRFPILEALKHCCKMVRLLCCWCAHRSFSTKALTYNRKNSVEKTLINTNSRAP